MIKQGVKNMDTYINMKIHLIKGEIKYLKKEVKNGRMKDNKKEKEYIFNRLEELRNEVINILESDRYTN